MIMDDTLNVLKAKTIIKHHGKLMKTIHQRYPELWKQLRSMVNYNLQHIDQFPNAIAEQYAMEIIEFEQQVTSGGSNDQFITGMHRLYMQKNHPNLVPYSNRVFEPMIRIKNPL